MFSLQTCLSLLLLISLMLDAIQSQASDGNVPLGIPGATETISGYDTALGHDAICWETTGFVTNQTSDSVPLIKLPNELVENFTLTSSDKVQLLQACPNGTNLTAFAPDEQYFLKNQRLLTRVWYNYSVVGTVDLRFLQGKMLASDNGTELAIQVLACDTIKAGFCSPFVHEEANAWNRAHNITAKTLTGNRHGGTHVHSPFVIKQPVPPNATVIHLNLSVPMLINQPGNFFVIGNIQLFTSDSSPFAPTRRYDIANALNGTQRLVSYQDAPRVLVLSQGIKITSYVVIGCSAIFLLFLLYQTIRNYSNQVLKLSQAPFLILFQLAGLVMTLSTIFLDPRSDAFCKANVPLIFVSAQLFYSIILARLWRINAVVSPLLKSRLQRAKSSRRNMASCPWHIHPRLLRLCSLQNNKSFRREVTNSQVAILISMACFPQVVLQIVSAILQPGYRDIVYNQDYSVGRETCAREGVHDRASDIFTYSVAFLLLLVVGLWIMAHRARKWK